MFYKLIQNKCDEWMKSPDCTIRELIQYIYTQNKMRDVQIEAIKIYLFLKIACGNRPLWQLFTEGRFNSSDFNTMELTVEARKILTTNKAAAALFGIFVINRQKWKSVSTRVRKRHQIAE